MSRWSKRPAVDCQRDLEDLRRCNSHLFPPPEQDLSRAAIRFAGEALLAIAAGDDVPEAALMRALTIAEAMARG